MYDACFGFLANKNWCKLTHLGILKFNWDCSFFFRYVVIKKLGWGHFSTVWMVKDRKIVTAGRGSQFFALKVQKSAEHYTEAAMDEVELLDCIASERKKSENDLISGDREALQMVKHSRFVATLHDSFFHSGPNGRHMCMVFSMLGCNLLSVIKAYNYRGIPVDCVKKMVRGVCQGLDFLHRKCHIIHTDLKPENVLLQYPHQINSDDDISVGVAALAVRDVANDSKAAPVPTIADLERALNDPTISRDEKKKIRKRLKKKRQKERKRGQTDESSDTDGSAGDEEEEDSGDRSRPISSMLSDVELGKILNRATNLVTSDERNGTVSPASHERVIRRLHHSPFVYSNFGPFQKEADWKIMETMKEKVEVSSSSVEEFVGNMQSVEGGVATVSILMRAYRTKEELIDGISEAIGLSCTESTGAGLEWRLSLSLIQTEPGSKSTTDIKTAFLMQLQPGEELPDLEQSVLTDLVTLVSENLSGEAAKRDEPEMADSPGPASPVSNALSLLTVTFPVRSTYVVTSFLESRLPGVLFLSYRREEGLPPLDNVLFGSKALMMCDHPLAMKIQSDPDDPAEGLGSTIVGFDLRLVKAFDDDNNDDGSPSSFVQPPEKALDWWQARTPIQDRLKSFTGIDPTADVFSLLSVEDERQSRRAATETESGFHEGSKMPVAPIPEDATAPSSRDTSASSAARSASQQPDLKDVDMLMKCRSVVVDLGNACWTHRHFSEDIQTRQYRAPEVLIGSNYDTSADIWSLGCMTFELLTGDLLFDPRAGEDYDRDEDHLAMFQELLGKMPKRLALDGKYSKNFFDKRGNLKRIKQLKFWPIEDVLMEKYHFPAQDAKAVADFMVPLLDFDPKTRATALDALESEWLKDV